MLKNFFLIFITLHNFLYVHKQNKFYLFSKKSHEKLNYIFVLPKFVKKIGITSQLNFTKLDKTFLQKYAKNVSFLSHVFYYSPVPDNFFFEKKFDLYLKNTNFLFFYLHKYLFIDFKRLEYISNCVTKFYVKSFSFLFYFFYFK